MRFFLKNPAVYTVVISLLAVFACRNETSGFDQPPSGDIFARQRDMMVSRQIAARGVNDPKVLEAMRRVPRHLFVPSDLQNQAYNDHPLPIGYDQTISQPFIVGLMTDLLGLKGDERVLEIGTGSGYQAAILGEIAAEVYTIEIVHELALSSEKLLSELGYENIHVLYGNGYLGWPEKAPFDAIMVTAAPPEIPQPLIDQLKIGGKLVIPVGKNLQELLLCIKTPTGLQRHSIIPVRFVPMVDRDVEN